MEMYINDIYHSFEGEGIFVGCPQIFIRFQGCAIGCKNCDSKYTWKWKEKNKISFEQVEEKVMALFQKYNISRISITGGDPLHLKNRAAVKKIINAFQKKFSISIEASGNCVVPDIFDLVHFINFDYKTPSTEVKCNYNHLKKVIVHYFKKLQIKSVVETEEDFLFLKHEKEKLFNSINLSINLTNTNTKLNKISNNTLDNILNSTLNENFNNINNILHNINWIITPAYNEQDKLQQVLHLTKKIIDWNFKHQTNFRIIPQQHKLVYGNTQCSI